MNRRRKAKRRPRILERASPVGKSYIVVTRIAIKPNRYLHSVYQITLSTLKSLQKSINQSHHVYISTTHVLKRRYHLACKLVWLRKNRSRYYFRCSFLRSSSLVLCSHRIWNLGLRRAEECGPVSRLNLFLICRHHLTDHFVRIHSPLGFACALGPPLKVCLGFSKYVGCEAEPAMTSRESDCPIWSLAGRRTWDSTS